MKSLNNVIWGSKRRNITMGHDTGKPGEPSVKTVSSDGPFDSCLEVQYNNQRRVPEFPQLIEQWRRRSRALQAGSDCRLDLAYGEGSRDRFDYYACGELQAPLLIYLHGQAGELNFDPEQIYLSGHSAGGHLTALLLTTDFSQQSSKLPRSLLTAGISISGLFDLEPLIPTSINRLLNLNRERARALSPLHMTPVSQAPLLACVGADESAAFLHQSRDINQAWSHCGQYLEIPACNHFTVLESLADTAGRLCAGLRELRGSIL